VSEKEPPTCRWCGESKRKKERKYDTQCLSCWQAKRELDAIIKDANMMARIYPTMKGKGRRGGSHGRGIVEDG